MLHRQDPAGLIVITQPMHAWISGCLARAWGNNDFGDAPKEEVCLAAQQHDIGWLLWENAPTLNAKTGYPYNFMELPTTVHLGIWSGAKQLALPFGRYVTLLVSLHGTGLYERFRSWQNAPKSIQEEVQEFLKHEKAFQEKLATSLIDEPYYAPDATPEVIGRNRSLVALWDRISLAVCMRSQHEQQFNRVPTATGETTIALTALDDEFSQIQVSPWPFQQSEVKLVYEGRRLPEQFTDETAMREALVAAEWVTMTTTLRGQK